MKTRAIKFAALAALNSLRREVRALLRKRRDARAATIVTRAGRQAKMEPLAVKSTLIDAVYFSQEDGRVETRQQGCQRKSCKQALPIQRFRRRRRDRGQFLGCA